MGDIYREIYREEFDAIRATEEEVGGQAGREINFLAWAIVALGGAIFWIALLFALF